MENDFKLDEAIDDLKNAQEYLCVFSNDSGNFMIKVDSNMSKIKAVYILNYLINQYCIPNDRFFVSPDAYKKKGEQ
jgi:hypothetical protein